MKKVFGRERRALFVAAALVSFTAVGGVAQEKGVDWIIGSQLFDDCQRDESFCLGYVMGAAASFPGQGSSFCLTAEVKGNQLKDMVTIWLGEHPELQHKTASFLVLQALKEKFPCK